MSSTQHLPIDVDAERAILSGVLTSPEALLSALEHLEPLDFGLSAHQDIYAAVTAADHRGNPVDSLTVADELRKAKALRRVGGTDTLTALIDNAGTVDNIEAHIRIVLDKARLRRLIYAGRTISGAALEADADASGVTETAEQLVFDISRERGTSSMIPLHTAVTDALADLAVARTSSLLGVSTGLDELDRMTGGLQSGQLITIAARPGVGKSAIAVQIARAIAQSSGKTVPLLSFEMSVSEIATRLLAAELQYDLHKLRQGDFPPGMERDIAEASTTLAAVPLLIDDNPPDTITALRSAMRRLAMRSELGAIVIDYLQLMNADGGRRDENRNQEISTLTRGLKRLASELGIPVIALSQLNRALEQRPNKRPILADLRDSGSIEQDSSIVLFLHREHVFNPAADPEAAELIIAKQRNGPCGTIALRFVGPSTLFLPGAAMSIPTARASVGEANKSFNPF